MKRIYSFLGLPASGKGTQADAFARKRGLLLVGTGDLIRAELEKGEKSDPFYREIKTRYESGVPQTDEIIFDLVKRKLVKTETGVVFDNFPFSKKQSAYLDRFIQEEGWTGPVVFYLRIDPETAIKRIVHRRICSECRTVYTGGESSICEKCGGALISRADDNEDTVRKRIGHYLPRIKEMIEIYKRGSVIEIDGEMPIPKVEAAVEQAAKKYE